jgi:SET domain-containing protein
MEYKGEILTEHEEERRTLFDEFTQHSYIFYEKDLYIDSRLKGNKSRCINHASHGEQNCAFKVVKVNSEPKVAIISLCFIPKGSEFFIHYNYGKNSFDWYNAYEEQFSAPKLPKKRKRGGYR